MPSVGFETVIPANKRLQAYAFDLAVSWIGLTPDVQFDNHKLWRKICGSIPRVDYNTLINTKIVPTPIAAKIYFSRGVSHRVL
jgi:hypothetical protein